MASQLGEVCGLEWEAYAHMEVVAFGNQHWMEW